MQRSRRSIYRLHDVMIAVAFTAIGLTWVETEWDAIRHRAGLIRGWSHQPLFPFDANPLYRAVRSAAATGLYVMSGIASPWAVYLLYRSRRPGRTWRFGRVRRPGSVACIAVTIVLTFELLHAAANPGRWPGRLNVLHRSDLQVVEIRHLSIGLWTPRETDDPFFNMLDGMPRHAGLLVAGAWLSLILARAWRPEPTWVDRAGRALGVCWIFAALHFYFLPL
jgi:hypothetical protein